jgi:hypothetical protein
MDILAPVPKTPSKPVPPVLILPTTELKLSLSANPREPSKNKNSRRMIPPPS